MPTYRVLVSAAVPVYGDLLIEAESAEAARAKVDDEIERIGVAGVEWIEADGVDRDDVREALPCEISEAASC